ncbi:Hypothetical_protein [Hexamita inflata]|uniref:Hypothetical_protein n=1 Tax=Hexamita inflata TaxID=28002 RepID=A0AA86NXA4_9EUKA|nr:Hypothetical protein HINF_LOCUS14572 [Hexamita inflata]
MGPGIYEAPKESPPEEIPIPEEKITMFTRAFKAKVADFISEYKFSKALQAIENTLTKEGMEKPHQIQGFLNSEWHLFQKMMTQRPLAINETIINVLSLIIYGAYSHIRFVKKFTMNSDAMLSCKKAARKLADRNIILSLDLASAYNNVTIEAIINGMETQNVPHRFNCSLQALYKRKTASRPSLNHQFKVLQFLACCSHTQSTVIRILKTTI